MIFRRREEDRYEPSSIGRMLTSPFRAIGNYFGGLLRRDDSIRTGQSWFSQAIGYLFLPFRLFVAFFNFMVHSWASTRSGWAFLQGLPALGLIFGFVSLMVISDFIHNEAMKIGTNFGYLNFHMKSNPEHPEYSEIFAERLVSIKPERDEFKYQLGLAYERSGKNVSAVDVMRSIAPEDEPRHANAHIWMSQNYMESSSPEMDPGQTEELVRRHLDHALSVEPNSQMAQISLANYYVDKAEQEKRDSEPYKANLELAVEHLTNVANGEITLNQLRAIPQLIELQLELGHENEAKRQSESLIAGLLPIALKNPEVFELWLTIVRCSVLVKNYAQALKIVKEGIQLAKDKLVKRRILQLASYVYLRRASDYPDMRDNAQYNARLNSLCEAIRLNPRDRDSFLKLLDFVNTGESSAIRIDETHGQTTALDFSTVEEIWLRDAIVGSPAPGVIHALLGMRAVTAGRPKEGQKHWRIAEQQLPNTQLVVNNLIDVAAQNRPEEFPNILEMITLAMKLFPEQAAFYQTRGIYFKSHGDLEAAIADFNFAMEKMPQLISLHQYLITCYEKLGDEQKVIEHKIMLEEKLSQLNPSDRVMVEAVIAEIN